MNTRVTCQQQSKVIVTVARTNLPRNGPAKVVRPTEESEHFDTEVGLVHIVS